MQIVRTHDWIRRSRTKADAQWLILAVSLPHCSARTARSQEQLMHDLGSHNEKVEGITEPSTHITSGC